MTATAVKAVPYFDLKRQYENLREEIEPVLLETARAGAYILSAKVTEFEAAFAAYCGADFAAGVGSGTDALTLSLRALLTQFYWS